MTLTKKDRWVILIAITMFTAMAFILGWLNNSEPFYGAGIGGAIGVLAVYFWQNRNRLKK